ncbi:hypothetical protein D6D04_08109 [Aureobasidium pullulans]|nr:hypothetical protein D6D04_08109 [Aureobasidium pullulans]
MLSCRKSSRLFGCFKVEQIPALSMTPKALGVGRNLTTPAEVTSVVLTSTTTSSSVSLSHESTPSKSTVRYLRSSHEAVAASEEAKRVEDPLVVASTDRARRKGNLPPSCFFIPHSILFVDHNTDLLAVAISITSVLCSTYAPSFGCRRRRSSPSPLRDLPSR